MMLNWKEIELAKQEKRHELVLNGNILTQKLEKSNGHLDDALFQLTNLNFLSLSLSSLTVIPEDIGELKNLTNLTLHDNKLNILPSTLGKLTKLKFIDVSGNQLETLPSEINNLTSLSTLNASRNNISSMPCIDNCNLLAHLNLESNKLKDFEFACYESLALLADLNLAENYITEIPLDISSLVSLKLVDLTKNSLKIIPGDISDCPKLKEIKLKGNPLNDRRFKKLVEADRSQPKQVLDYIKQHCQKSDDKKEDRVKKMKGGKKLKEAEIEMICDRLEVMFNNNPFTIKSTSDVKTIRPYLVCCLVRSLDLTGTKLKKFISLQTKLHDTVCDKRVEATIATHDLSKLLFPLCYDAKDPGSIVLHPLNRKNSVLATNFFKALREEAEALRKQMKRNTFSGIHKYLYLVDGWKKWPCLTNSDGTVISLPPITNSEDTKISESSTDILLEVTSSSTLGKAKEVMESLLLAILEADLSSMKMPSGKEHLHVEQLRVVDDEGGLKVVFPSRTDLLWKDNKIEIIRPQ